MKAGRKVLVTGGTGFIGQRLVSALVARGNTIVVLTRHPERHRTASAGVEFTATVSDLARVGAIVNLAGEPLPGRRWSPAQKRRLRESRVDRTRELVQQIAQAPSRPAVLVSASAVGIYGDRGAEVLTESSPPGDDFLAELCIAWEREAFAAREHGVRTVCVRTGIALGAGGGALAKMLPLFRAGIGGPLGDGSQFMSWVHVDDVVALLLFALERDELEGPLNGTAPNPVTNRDFTRALARELHRPAFLPAPRFALRAALGEIADALTGSQRCVPEKALAHGFVFRFPELQGALREVLASVPAAKMRSH